jgi:hypothetical protein
MQTIRDGEYLYSIQCCDLTWIGMYRGQLSECVQCGTLFEVTDDNQVPPFARNMRGRSWLTGFDHETRINLAVVMERAYKQSHKLERYGWHRDITDQDVSDMTSDIFDAWSDLIPTL